MPTCKTCKFHDGNYCCRFPPVGVYDSQLGDMRAAWPEVAADDWCGEYKAIPPTPAPSPDKPNPMNVPCVFLGNKVGTMAECLGCPGKVLLPVFACTCPGHTDSPTTTTKPTVGQKYNCRQCKEYVAPPTRTPASTSPPTP